MHNSKGFTLLELLSTALILAIMLSIGIPSFTDIGSKLDGLVLKHSLAKRMKASRAHAVLSGQATILCGTLDGRHCTSASFNELLMFEDLNRNFLLDNDERILVHTALSDRFGTLRWNHRLPLRFLPNGRVSTAGSFLFCPKDIKRMERALRVTTSSTGRIYIARRGKNGLVKTAGGREIRCN